MKGWLYYALAQVTSLAATVVGWFVLLPFCIAHAWELSPVLSIATYGPPRRVDRWSWGPLNAVYGNPEDGVSGQMALIWGSGLERGQQVPYLPYAPDWWRAYCWSAWRNSADNLKYVFRWRGPGVSPYKEGAFKLGGRAIKYAFGWKPENSIDVPVFSLKPA